jgi:hypothetical protein
MRELHSLGGAVQPNLRQPDHNKGTCALRSCRWPCAWHPAWLGRKLACARAVWPSVFHTQLPLPAAHESAIGTPEIFRDDEHPAGFGLKAEPSGSKKPAAVTYGVGGAD